MSAPDRKNGKGPTPTTSNSNRQKLSPWVTQKRRTLAGVSKRLRRILQAARTDEEPFALTVEVTLPVLLERTRDLLMTLSCQAAAALDALGLAEDSAPPQEVLDRMEWLRASTRAVDLTLGQHMEAHGQRAAGSGRPVGLGGDPLDSKRGKRIAIYAHASLADADSALECQISHCRDWLGELIHGTVVRVDSDRCARAPDDDQLRLRALTQAAQRGEFDVLACTDRSRLGHLCAASEVLTTLADAGVRVVFCDADAELYS